MQYTPLFNISDGDVCLSATSNGGVSGSLPIGPYYWEYHIFSASDQSVYNTASLYQFNMTQGYTEDGLLLLVGGGGGGANNGKSDGGSGGAGGVLFKDDLIMFPKNIPYTVQVGHAGDALQFSGGAIPSPSANGNDGKISRLIGVGDPNVDFGDGGYKSGINEYHNRGGDSGNGFSGSIQSSYQKGNGAGAIEDGAPPGNQFTYYGGGGAGFSVFNLLPSYPNNAEPHPFDDYEFSPIRVGGGGASFWYELPRQTYSDGWYFGGGKDGDRYGQNLTGGGGSGIVTGYGAGGTEFYGAGNGGHGCVIISYPQSLCDVYQTGTISGNNLVGNWDINHKDTVYKPYVTSINSLVNGYTLDHEVYYGGSILNQPTQSMLYSHMNSGTKPLSYDATGSLTLMTLGNNVGTLNAFSEYLTGSLSYDFSSSQQITVEGWFKRNFWDISKNKLIEISGPNDGFGIKFWNDKIGTYTAVEDEPFLSGSSPIGEWTHAVATLSSGSDLSFYLNSDKQSTTIIGGVINELSSPDLKIGVNLPGDTKVNASYGLWRIYDDVLTEEDVYQNFLLSHGRFYGHPYPSSSISFYNTDLDITPYTASIPSTKFDWDIQGMTSYVWSRGWLDTGSNNVITIASSSVDTTLGIDFDTISGSYGKYTDGIDTTTTLPLQTYDETLWHQHLTTWDFQSKQWLYYIDSVLQSSGSISEITPLLTNPTIEVGQSGSELRMGEGEVLNYPLTSESIVSLYDSQKTRYATENNTPTKQPITDIPSTGSLWSLIDVKYTASYDGSGEVFNDISTYFHTASISSSNGWTYEPAGVGKPLDGYLVVTDETLPTKMTWGNMNQIAQNEFSVVITWYGASIDYDSNDLFPIFADTASNKEFGLYGGGPSKNNAVIFKSRGFERILTPNSANNGPTVGWHITQFSWNNSTKEYTYNLDGVSGTGSVESSCGDTTCNQYYVDRCRTSAAGGCQITYTDCSGNPIVQDIAYNEVLGNICADPCITPISTRGSFDITQNGTNCGTYGPATPYELTMNLFGKVGTGQLGDASEFQVVGIYTGSLSLSEMEANYNELYNRY